MEQTDIDDVPFFLNSIFHFQLILSCSHCIETRCSNALWIFEFSEPLWPHDLTCLIFNVNKLYFCQTSWIRLLLGWTRCHSSETHVKCPPAWLFISGCTSNAASACQCRFWLSSALNVNTSFFVLSMNDIIFTSFDQSCWVEALNLVDKKENRFLSPV